MGRIQPAMSASCPQPKNRSKRSKKENTSTVPSLRSCRGDFPHAHHTLSRATLPAFPALEHSVPHVPLQVPGAVCELPPPQHQLWLVLSLRARLTHSNPSDTWAWSLAGLPAPRGAVPTPLRSGPHLVHRLDQPVSSLASSRERGALPSRMETTGVPGLHLPPQPR